MMFWNRKRLFADSSAEMLAKSCDALKQAKIPYEVKTTTSHGPIRRQLEMRKNIQPRNWAVDYKVYGEEFTHVYCLYVHKKDYPKAKSLLSL